MILTRLSPLGLLTTALILFAVQAQTLPAEEAAKDRSLTTKEYVDAGLPSPDQAWDVTEVPAISKTLKSLAEKDAGLLPRRSSARSGKVFERLVAADNWYSLKDKGLSIDTRRTVAAGTLKAMSAILDLYTPLLGKPGSPEGELVDLTGAMLRLMVATTRIMLEYRGADSKDPKYEKKTAELKQMGTGWAISVLSCAEMFSLRDEFPKDSRSRLCATLKTTLPDLVPVMPDDKRTELQSKLKACCDEEKDEALKKAIESLIQIVKDTPTEVK